MATAVRSDDRPRRRERSSVPSPGKQSYGRLVNPLVFQRSFSDDEVVHLHETALRVLAELGIKVLSAEAAAIFKSGGARVEGGGMVYIERGVVDAALATAPNLVTLIGGKSGRNVTLGGRHTAFLSVGGPPHVMDLDRGRRAGTVADMRGFIRLSNHFNVLHLHGSAVEPQDEPVHLRHYPTVRSQLELSGKPLFVNARGKRQVADAFEIIRLAHGLSEEQFAEAPRCYTVINTNSPRQLDVPMCEGLIDFARAGQMSVVTPFTLAGAMAPVTVAGALALAHAEALAGIVLTQIVHPGAPVVYGSFTSNVDMRSGAPAFGTPEFVRAAFGAGQLARHVGLPWRGSAATASNAPDAQAALETANSAWGSLLGGVNMLIHGAGWLEGGLSASFEKFILDIEMLQILAEVLLSPRAETEGIFEAIAEVPPGGHFFGTAHTMARYRDAFYEPLVHSRSNFGQWTEAGAKDAAMRANGIWKAILAAPAEPVIAADRLAAVDAFIDRRVAEGGAPLQ